MNIGTACCQRPDCADEACQGRMSRDHAIPPQRLSDLMYKRIPSDVVGYEAAWLNQAEGGEIVMYEPDGVMHWTEIVVYALLIVFVGGLGLWCVSRLAPFIL